MYGRSQQAPELSKETRIISFNFEIDIKGNGLKQKEPDETSRTLMRP